MKLFVYYIIIFILLFLIDYFVLKNIKILEINEFDFIINLKKIKIKQPKNFKFISSILNSLIMSTVCLLAKFINLPLILVVPICFIVLILLIYSVYEIYGRILEKNEKQKK